MTGMFPVMLVCGLVVNMNLGGATRENLEEEAAKVRGRGLVEYAGGS